MTHYRMFAATLALASGLGAAAAQAAFLPRRRRSPSAIVRVDTSVDQMPSQMATAYIESLQKELAIHGYKPGPIDGRMGSRTRAAIRAYQRDAGLQVDGVATKELVERLMFVDTGTTGDQTAGTDKQIIRSVQIELLDRGYYHGAIDGIAGPETTRGIREFQAAEGQVVDGLVDGTLLDELRSADPSIKAGS